MTRNNHRFFLPMLAISLMMIGCTHTASKQAKQVISQNWDTHQTQVEALNHWQAIGKLGVKVPNDGGSAGLHWQQQNSDFQIDLNGPFGQSKMTIAGADGKVTFTEAGKGAQSAKTAEELITKNTGWTIPVTQLAYWIRGLPAPNAKVTHLEPNPQGLIGEIEQLGWKVTYGDYLTATKLDAADTIAMPGRITAEYHDLRLTLIIREWRFE